MKNYTHNVPTKPNNENTHSGTRVMHCDINVFSRGQLVCSSCLHLAPVTYIKISIISAALILVLLAETGAECAFNIQEEQNDGWQRIENR